MDRFWSKVSKSPGCWEWTASKHPLGYGKFKWEGKTQWAHRVAWLLTHGPIPDGMFICHSCDNPGCVNPEHLFMGSPRENAEDKARKVRGPHILLPEEVLLMRELRSQGLLQRELAERFGVARETVSKICAGRSWKWLASG